MWQLDGDNARLETSQLSCAVNLADLSAGVQDFAIHLNQQQEISSRDLTVARLIVPGSSPKLSDVYVRGRDVVATYGESAQYPCRLQVYWSFDSQRDAVGLRIIISTQTSQLDVPSKILQRSEFSSEPRLLENDTAVVATGTTELAYVELSDSSNVESTVTRGNLIERSMFAGALEKGVIRRARLLACFVSSQSVEEAALALHDRFVASDLPLTT